MSVLRNLLWVDCAAGAGVGIMVITFSEWLSRVEGVPRGILLFTGVVNLCYACYSFSLAVQARRKMSLIKTLVFANLAWAPVCLGLAFFHWNEATGLGLLHLIGEAIFVGGLAILEWSQRDRLLRGS